MGHATMTDTLLVVLVVLVVILFLQTWRASIIPLIAVPVSVIPVLLPILTNPSTRY